MLGFWLKLWSKKKKKTKEKFYFCHLIPHPILPILPLLIILLRAFSTMVGSFTPGEKPAKSNLLCKDTHLLQKTQTKQKHLNSIPNSTICKLNCGKSMQQVVLS